jgi:hypothetical protein
VPKLEKDKDREYRIDMEVVVDAYDSEERAIGWYYYVSDVCDFPFWAPYSFLKFMNNQLKYRFALIKFQILNA